MTATHLEQAALPLPCAEDTMRGCQLPACGTKPWAHLPKATVVLICAMTSACAGRVNAEQAPAVAPQSPGQAADTSAPTEEVNGGRVAPSAPPSSTAVANAPLAPHPATTPQRAASAPTEAPAALPNTVPEHDRAVSSQPRRDDPYFELERCPPEMALLPRGVCIDRWEASLVEVLASGKEQPWSPYKPPTGNRRFMAVSRRGVVPQGYINGRRAADACQAAGKRLCRPSEWELACRGPARTPFPYGTQRRKGTCNDDGRGRHPVAEAGRRLGWSLDRMWREGMDHELINQLPNTVDRTGAHEQCTNAYGAFDMVGNLHEWVDDPDGTFRGGFFMDTKINGDGCDYATTAHSISYHDYSIGFRCCKDAQDT